MNGNAAGRSELNELNSDQQDTGHENKGTCNLK
jgi:hypothetical protein